MYAPRALLLACAAGTLGCGRGDAPGGATPPMATPPTVTPPTVTPPTTATATAAAPPGGAPCVPPGLDGARELPVVAAPPGCSFQALESLERPEVLADDAAVAARLACAPGTTPALALGDDQLMLAAHRLSPASVGLAVFDDGATITYVSRQRPPCADDPPPMPSPSVPLAFRLPRGATRAFRTLACDLPPSCP